MKTNFSKNVLISILTFAVLILSASLYYCTEKYRDCEIPKIGSEWNKLNEDTLAGKFAKIMAKENFEETDLKMVKITTDICLKYDPNDVFCLIYRAHALRAEGKLNEALDALLKAANILKTWPEIQNMVIDNYYTFSDGGKTEKWNLEYTENAEWRGKIATDLSQIDGVKFYFVDSNNVPSSTFGQMDWFWAEPEDLTDLTAEQTGGKWVQYMLKRFGDIDIDKIDTEKDIFLVSGKFDYRDCGYLNGHVCIPVIKVDRIKKAEN